MCDDFAMGILCFTKKSLPEISILSNVNILQCWVLFMARNHIINNRSRFTLENVRDDKPRYLEDFLLKFKKLDPVRIQILDCITQSALEYECRKKVTGKKVTEKKILRFG